MTKKIKVLVLVIGAAVALVAGAGCSKKSGGDGHSHAHHHHTAPHGGTLVELGDHQYNLELVRDAGAGTLTVYLLDGHAENFVRVPMPVIALVATVKGVAQPLTMMATANAATGETVGSTSQFVAQAEWVKTAEQFEVVVPGIEIRGAKFTDVKFNFPKGSDDHGH
ncbi:hypothetical protein [Nibricoccus aquaticus]|nr:hypothetical protein [Nibricoccus aquaticus]